MKKLFIILLSFICVFGYAQQGPLYNYRNYGELVTSPNAFNFGYSYSTEYTHVVWMSFAGIELGYGFDNNTFKRY